MKSELLNSKRRFFATALAITLVAFLGFLFIISATPKANAESFNYRSGDYAINYNYGFVKQDTSSSFYWSGNSSGLVLSFPDSGFTSSNITTPFNFFYNDVNYTYSNVTLTSYFQTSGVTYPSVVSKDFYKLYFANSSVNSRTLSMNVDVSDSYLHFITFVFQFNLESEYFSGIAGSDSDVEYVRGDLNTCWALNDTTFGAYVSGAVNQTCDVVAKVLSSDRLITSARFTYSTVNLDFDLDFDLSDIGSSANYPYVVFATFPITTSGEYILRRTTNTSGKETDSFLLGCYHNSILLGDNLVAYDSGYNAGYNAGQSAGYDSGYNAGQSAGIEQGKTDAFKTVNTSSASYQAGYSKGVNSAGNYTFLSLISAVIDAPIRAFFGYTENGVTHPGLFSLNILGFDMSALILSMFTACVIIMIIKLCLGGK